ncbi:hypothetical protein DFH29DRAFT_1037474 [Suillus ampliporus]|nr:hypothetical protein DFH29DRAFT_1037474 [Suillus ampliporus]
MSESNAPLRVSLQFHPGLSSFAGVGVESDATTSATDSEDEHTLAAFGDVSRRGNACITHHLPKADVSPTRPRQHQHQGSYNARYARHSFEGRPRRDETKSGAGEGPPDCMTLAVTRVPTTTATHNHLLPHNPASRPSHSHADSYDISGRRHSGRMNNIPVGPILRKPSDESLRSGKSGKSGKPYRNSPGPRPGRGIENVPPVPSSLELPPQSRDGVTPPQLKPTRMNSLPGPISSSIPFGTDPPPSPSSFSTFNKEQEEIDRDCGHGSQRRPNLKRLRALYQCAAIHICIPPAGVSHRGLPSFELRSGDTFDVLKEYGHPSAHPDLPLYEDDKEDHLLLVKVADGGTGEVGWALASFLVPLDLVLLGQSLSPPSAFDID